MTGKLIDREESKFEENIGCYADNNPFADDENGDKPVCGDGVHVIPPDVCNVCWDEKYYLFM